MISAVVLTYNEEENIVSCLDGLKWCNQVIVVDMSSTDNTVELAKSKGAEIYTAKKKKNFDLLRNIGIEKALHDWILIIDADEIIPYTLSQWILNDLKSDKYDIYRISRLAIQSGSAKSRPALWCLMRFCPASGYG